VGPARSTILGDVLIERLGTVVHAVLVTPRKVGWERLIRDVILRQGRDDVTTLVRDPGGFVLRGRPDFIDTS
jgi:hypothetical protein